jgi:hypothetical protein
METQKKTLCLSFAIRQDCLLAISHGNGTPTLTKFSVTDEAGGLLEFEKVMVGKTPLVELMCKGDKLYTEVGGPSNAFCLQALERGLEVYRFHSYELTQVCERQEINPRDRQARFELLVVQVNAKEPDILPSKMLETDKPVARISALIDAYVQVQQEQRIRAEQRAAVRNRNLAWMPATRLITKAIDILQEGLDIVFYKNVESKLIAAVEGDLPNVAIWTDFLKGVYGCGPSIGARLIGKIGDIRRFPKLAGFRAYCGFAVYDGKMAKFKRGNGDEGKRNTFSPSLRQAL